MKNTTIKLAFLTAALAVAVILISAKNFFKESPTIESQLIDNQPEELGKVNWLRSISEAEKRSRDEGRPILILFQEVPGCATCRRYGNRPLSHPLMVEAIETAFVPLAIFNNKKGEDAEVLRYFREPSWNNPVVRIVDAQRKDIVPRLGGDYTPFGLVNSMLRAFDAQGKTAPQYLEILAEEFQAEMTGTETATLSMYCFWTGEKELAQVPGVVSTEAGWMGGREVVQVEFNPEVTSYEQLVSQARKSSCASHVFTEGGEQAKAAADVVGRSATSPAGDYRTDHEPKYYLSRTHWRYVPMTPLQSARANSLIGQRKSPAEVLSPRQIELADFIFKNKNRKWKNAVGVELGEAWEAIE